MYSEEINNQLIEKWKGLYTDGEPLYFDGACDEYQYNTAEKKILFILREVVAYDNFGNLNWLYNINITDREFIPEWVSGRAGRHPTYTNCIKIARLILKDYTTSNSEFVNKLAFINLSKVGGYQYSTMNNKQYLNIAKQKENVELLKRQISNLNPDVIVAATYGEGWELVNEICEISDYPLEVHKKGNTSLFIRNNGNKVIYYTCHPSSRTIHNYIKAIEEYISNSPSPDATV